MVRDVTADWQQRKPHRGLYVMRGQDAPHRGIVRIGVGGIRSKSSGLFTRIKSHSKTWTGRQTVGTHECGPYDLIRAWELSDWTKVELENGEHCLYRAFAVCFPRRTEGLPDESLFLVPEKANLEPVLADIKADLEAIERLREAAADAMSVR